MPAHGGLADEAGSSTPANLIWAVILLGLAGLAVDTANAYRVRAMMQYGADAAALAAAQHMPDREAAAVRAQEYVEANLPPARFGPLWGAGPIAFGQWNATAGAFHALEPGQNAGSTDTVRVTLRRTRALGNPVGTFLLGVFGWQGWDIGVQSVARAGGACSGVMAGGVVSMALDVHIRRGTCIYGRAGVTFALEPTLERDTRIGSADLANLHAGPDPRFENATIFADDLTAPRAPAIAQTLDEWESTGKAFGLTVQVVDTLPLILTDGTAYIATGDLDIEGDHLIRNVIVAARGNIDLGPAAALRNRDDCRDAGAIGLYATGDIRIGQGATGHGIDIVAGRDIVIDQTAGVLNAVLEAGDDIIVQQSPDFRGCRPLWGLGGHKGRLVL